jgi:hypothetical protein
MRVNPVLCSWGLVLLLCCFFGPCLCDYVSVFCPGLHKNRLIPVGDPPSPRAAHAATAVGTMIVVQV